MSEPSQNHEEWHQLFSAALNETITDAGKARLNEVLKASPAARELWFLYQDNEIAFGEMKPRPKASSAEAQSSAPRRATWFQWRPLMAAAAGLVVGLFSASLVWGYAVAAAGKAVSLLKESFEAGPAPLVKGVPLTPGVWSGDFTVVVGEYQGVKPVQGTKMLRFLRADYQDKPRRDGYIADLFRIIDLNVPSLEVMRGDASVSVEARFRSLPQDKLERVRCSVTIHALDALPEAGEIQEFYLKPRDGVAAGEGEGKSSGANILATTTRQEMFDSSSNAWHLARTELLVPPGTKYLMVHIHEWLPDSGGPRAPQPVSFEGLFLDDIRVNLTHRPLVP